jgi:hypothetical protein
MGGQEQSGRLRVTAPGDATARRGHGVVRGKVGGGGVGTGIGSSGFGIRRPYGRRDGRHGGEQLGVFLCHEQGTVPTHRNTHDAQLLRMTTESTCLAHGDQLVDHHSHGIVSRVGVPIPSPAVRRHHGHGGKRTAVHMQGKCLWERQSGQRISVVGPVTVERDDER